MPRRRGSLSGFREARESLQELSKATQRNVGKRALAETAEAALARSKRAAPVSDDPYNKTPGSLRDSGDHGPGKTRRGRSTHAIWFDDVAAVPTELGTSKMAARPWWRPLMNRIRGFLARTLGAALKREVDAAAARVARKAKRQRG